MGRTEIRSDARVFDRYANRKTDVSSTESMTINIYGVRSEDSGGLRITTTQTSFQNLSIYGQESISVLLKLPLATLAALCHDLSKCCNSKLIRSIQNQLMKPEGFNDLLRLVIMNKLTYSLSIQPAS